MRLIDICQTQVATVNPETSVATAAALMKTAHVGDLVVTIREGESHKPWGIVTDRDIVTLVVAEGLMPESVKISDIMAPQPNVALLDASLEETLSSMVEWEVRRLPVIDHDGSLVGIVSIDDLYVVLAAKFNELASLSARQIAREHREVR